MSDRCNVFIVMRKSDLGKFAKAAGETTEFLRDCISDEDKGILTIDIEDVPYGYVDKRHQAANAGIAFVGSHDPGNEYSACLFAAFGGEMEEVVDGNGHPMVKTYLAENGDVMADLNDLLRVKRYYKLKEEAEQVFRNSKTKKSRKGV